ncbi:MAG: ATP-binding cassette domain-containing protein [Staphylococcus epidermidis]|nr:ATP-binding cassette domain-containing protein [Staphylococcus epidermidis]
MKKLTKMVLSYKLYPTLMLIMSVFLSFTVVAQNISISHFLNHLLYYQQQSLLLLLSVIFISLILRATFNMLIQFLGDHLAFKVKHMLREQVILKKSVRSIGEEINILTESIDGIGPFFQSYLPQVFKSMLIPIVIIITMCFVHLPTAIIMLNTAKGLITFKLLNQTKQSEQQLYKDSTRFRDLTMRILKSAFLSGLMLEFISMLGIGLVALEAALSLVVFNHINFVTAAIAIILAPEFYNAIKDLGQAFHTGKQSEGASDVVFSFLESEDKADSPTLKVDEQQFEQVLIKHVDFQYANSNHMALKNISFSVNKGEKVAIVGPSGAGKSTLAKLLSQSVTPTHGTLSFNQASLNIGFLSQRPHIFADSIKNNIAMYDDEICDEQVIQVLDEVGLKEKVLSLKYGIYTSIGEGGEMLSGGQMRRIELSRLLLLKPDIVIFDEPAIGLDIETEKVIQQVLEHHFSTTTVFIIAHRDSTIRSSARRIYIESGHLIKDDSIISVTRSEVKIDQ